MVFCLPRRASPDDAPSLSPTAHQDASILSQLTYSWISPLIRRGWYIPLQLSDLPAVIEKDKSSFLGPRFHHAYRFVAAIDIRKLRTHKSGHQNRTDDNTPTTSIGALPFLSRCASYLVTIIPSKWTTRSSRALFIVTAPTFISAALVKPVWFLSVIGQAFTINYLLKRLVEEHANPPPPTTRWAYLPLVFALAFSGCTQSIGMHTTFTLSTTSGIRARAAIASQVYSKVLRLDPSAFGAITSEGELGNLLVTDLQRVFDAYTSFHFFWLGVIELIVICALLSIELGVSTFVGFGFLILLIPVQMTIASCLKRARMQVTKIADTRIQKMNEILSGIGFIKYSVWESHFRTTIQKLRRSEIKYLSYTAMLRAISITLFFISPIFVSLFTFSSYTLIFNRHLSPSIAFLSISFYTIIATTLAILPNGLLATSEASISFQRMDRFFNLPELPSISSKERLDLVHPFHSSSDSSNAVQLSTTTQEQPDSSDQIPESAHGESPHIFVSRASFTYSGELATTSADSHPVISDVTITAHDGDLICILGAVGSGKSALLSGILGELRCTRGYVQTRGRIAYCAQEPWIINGTFRDNVIMFGEGGRDSQFNKMWYDVVIDKCCLRPDIEGFPAGDRTEIGERGLNLSGGQKARLTLARAVYSNSDVYILDDPLSAVDASVMSHLIRCLFGPSGLLSQKVQIIATHQVSLLRYSSNIVVLNEGTIAHSGTFNELTALGVNFSGLQKVSNVGYAGEIDPKGEFKVFDSQDGEPVSQNKQQSIDAGHNVEGPADMMMRGKILKFDSLSEPRQAEERDLVEDTNSREEHDKGCTSSVEGNRDANIEELCTDNVTLPKTSKGSTVCKAGESLGSSTTAMLTKERNAKDGPANLIADEDRNFGQVTWPVFKIFIRAGGGFLVLLGILIVLLGAQALRQLSKVWVGVWTSGVEESLNPDSRKFFDENVSFVKVIIGFTFGALVLSLLQAVLFVLFIMVSSRRIHNRLLKRILVAKMSFFDTNPLGRILNRFSKDVDQMDIALPTALQQVLQYGFSSLSILVTVCYILPWFLIALVPLVFSFLYVQTIYKKSSRELKRLDGVTASSTYSKFVETLSGIATIRAFGFQKEFAQSFERLVDTNHIAVDTFEFAGRWVGFRLDLLATICVSCTALAILGLGASVDIGLAGVALTESILMAGSFQWGVRQAAETENIFTSVERVVAMAVETPVETGFDDGDDESKKPDDNWPSQGEICFKEVVLKYRPDLDAALNGISFSTGKCERVGIVGRTGSGKSSLLVSLFRIVELHSGMITIDGQDISKVSLPDLRSRMAIVPQDPVMFTGTVRSNLDPLGRYNDSDLWDALRRVNMSDVLNGPSQVEGMDLGDFAQGLDGQVQEKGSNFSIGERQLLSLARVIVSGVKVVVLDEASASLDNHTDRLIQQTVHEQLRDRTVITIAHRLATVVDCDRVLVVDSGSVAEFDTPVNLMNRGGKFSRLISECGPTERKNLKAKMKKGSGSMEM